MSPPTSRWRPSQKVLVASGEAQLRKLMRIALDDFDSRPSEASDGITLLREAYTVHPDIIVIHRELPDQDGLEIIGRLKEDLHLQRPPVIIVTNGKDPDARLACFAADADDVMSVPFDARELKARVEAVLRRTRSKAMGMKNPFSEKHLSALAGNVFDTFVEGRANRAAVEAAKSVADDPGHRFNPLFIYGPPGTGKTHLLSAIGHHTASVRPDTVVMYVSTSDFSNEFLAAVATGEMELFRSKYGHADILLLDDIQYMGGGDSLLLESARLIKQLSEQGRQVVASSDRSLADLKGAIGEVADILDKGLVAKIVLPDRDLRYGILQTQSLIHKWNLSEQILRLVADIVASDARALQGAARKLVALRTIQGGVMTPEKARNALSDLVRGEEVVEEAALKASTASTASRPRTGTTGSSAYEMISEEEEEKKTTPKQALPPEERKPPRSKLRKPAAASEEKDGKEIPQTRSRPAQKRPATVRPGKTSGPDPSKSSVRDTKEWLRRVLGKEE